MALGGERAGDVSRACAACGAPTAEGERLCQRCRTTADGLTPAIEIDDDVRASGTVRRPVELDQGILPPGTQLGSYRIVELIGRGGIGYVYLADHVRLGRQVAIKMLRTRYGREPSVVSRFFAEARAANQIAHENIVQITDFIEDEEYGAYIIMELLDGVDLDELLETEVVLPVRRTLHIMLQVASALAVAHRSGIVHRDLKPENIFLTRVADDPDFVKLLDFGVAKLTKDPLASSGHATADGAVVGTPAYMSPEQARGRKVDYRTDIYSFGVILYELLSGELPFEADTLGDFIVLHATEEPRPLSEQREAQGISPELSELAMRCLLKDPAERPKSMAEVESTLRSVAATEAPSLEPPAPVLTTLPPPRRGRAVTVALAAVGALALVGGGVWLAWPAPPAAPPGPLPKVAAKAPPPPEPEPPPAVVEPEPETVTLRFTSRPPGAEVWPEGAEAPLGVTPLRTTVPRSDEDAVFELRLEGRPNVSEEVSLAHDATVHVVLPRAAPRRRSRRSVRSARAPRRSRRNAVIDPFE